MRLAVVLLSLGAAVLAWATFSIERNWGTPATHFAVYGSWWFGLLLGLLAVNVFASAAIRFPWKRYQTGFVLIHSGILVLLLGALLSKMYGVGGQLWVVEGRRSNRAYEERKIIRLAVTDRATDSASDENERSQESDKNERSEEDRHRYSFPVRPVQLGRLFEDGGLPLASGFIGPGGAL